MSGAVVIGGTMIDSVRDIDEGEIGEREELRLENRCKSGKRYMG
jgi:hypothetical protein